MTFSRQSSLTDMDLSPSLKADQVTDMNAPLPISPPLPLTMAPEGRSLQIVDVAQSPRYRSRLADLGLTGGAVVSVVQRGGSDPYLLAVNGARIAIGAGLAAKILVTELDG